jgi:hypothetical protein
MRASHPASALAVALVLASGCTGSSPDTSEVQIDPVAATSTTSTTRPLTAVSSPAEVVAPKDAHDAAARITVIEHALRDPATPPGQLPALGWQQQVVYRSLAVNEAWLPQVLTALPGDVAIIVTANVGGGSSISSTLDPPKALPEAWHIVTPPPPETLLSYYREAQAVSGVDWSYLAAINLVETRMGRIVGDSTAGAQGPMQFLPSTWTTYGKGGDIRAPRDSILAAGRYLAAAGGPKNMRGAIFAYNHSDAYVDAVMRYASVMAADERAYLGYYQWQVFYRTVDSLYLLLEGYPQVAAVKIS